MICARDLTLAERAELERAYDGPIPPQAIADKIRMRRPLSRDEALTRVREIGEDIKYYIACAKTETSDYMRKWDLARVDELLKEQKKLDDMLDEMREQPLAAE